MADAAFLEYKRLDPKANVLPSLMRRAMQAALDAMPKATGGLVNGDSVRLRLSDASCTYTLPPEMTRGQLPPNATVSINLGAPDDKTIIETLARMLTSPLAALGGHPLPRGATVEVNLGGDMIPRRDGVTQVLRTRPHGDTGEHEASDGTPYGPQPSMVIPDERCCICGSTDVDYRNYLGQPWCWPCADGQQTFLVNEAGIATKFDVPQHTANTWIRYGDGCVPPFPSAIRMTSDGREGLYSLREVETWHKAWLNGKQPFRMSLTEPRPLATVGELHHHLGESREFVLRAAAGMPEYDPPFPDPVCEYGEDREPLYDPQAVKAWYDALPQAADG